MASCRIPPHPVTDPAVGAGRVSGEVEHVVQGQQARGHALQVLRRVAVLGEGGEAAEEGPSPLEQQQPRVEAGAGSWIGVTHREAQFAELAGTEGTATVSTQPSAQGLPLRFKGSLTQSLQLLPLLLGSLLEWC